VLVELQGKERIFQVLFTLPLQRNGFSNSYLAQNKLFESFILCVPDRQDMKEVDRGKQLECNKLLVFAFVSKPCEPINRAFYALELHKICLFFIVSPVALSAWL
jgi:hypothetical protein